MTLEELNNEVVKRGDTIFLDDHLSQLKDYIQQRDTAKVGTKEFVNACECVSNQYNMIYGFLWGLYAAGSITQRERGDLTGELCKECGYK